MTLREKIKGWYEGELTSEHGERYSAVYYERHWSSSIAHTLVDFYFKEWKWVWGTIIAVVSLALAIAKLRS